MVTGITDAQDFLRRFLLSRKMDLDTLTNAFEGVSGFFKDIGPNAYYAFRSALFLYGGYALINKFRKKKRSKRRLLEKGIVGGRSCIGTTTSYVYDPKTGKYRQNIRTSENEIDLSAAFDESIRKDVMRYIDKARKHCNGFEISPLQHLEKVIPKKKRAKIIPLIHKGWQNYCSSLYKEQRRMLEAKITRKDQYIEEKPRVFALVSEKDVQKEILRVFEINPKQINLENLPYKWEVEFDKPHHADRLNSNIALAYSLEKDQKFRNMVTIMVPTGEIKRMKLPKRKTSRLDERKTVMASSEAPRVELLL